MTTNDSYAYLGPEGTYSHQAAFAFLDIPASETSKTASETSSAENPQLIECSTISEVFDLVDRGRATFGVVPIENALEGSVNETLDTFAFTSGAQIQGETVLDIHHSLVVPPGVGLKDIEVVASHPQALAQCRRWLAQHLPNAATIATTSTAGAVQTALASEGRHTAGIGTEHAAQLFGGVVLEREIEDHFGNQTRFVLIGNQTHQTQAHPQNSDGYKTSLALFMREDRPGTLLMILEEFAYAGLNLTKIQSRPTKRALGDYMFWIDIDGHTDDPDVRTALDCLRLKLREVKSFGSYLAAPKE
ncbi:MAG: prephenate dehydratase [Coriobacteriales bacterium]|jgi:prephenate dehydratase|nr:prephenate dehydratase [Coriobacteriales bacterium]